tara:strand:- start:155 stop:1981 length:1827 start_codon:yes stop_codon:yes gene_type:complete
MKKFMKQALLVFSMMILIYACSKDDDPTPEPGATPTITSFSPSSGAIGTQVTITGTNFSSTAANNVVKFGTVTATVSTASATSLVTTVPLGATTGKISVTANKKTATSATDFTVTTAQIALNNSTLTLYPYPKYKAILKVTTDIGAKTITWTSSDETIATVSADGEVTPLAIGNVIITATVGEASGQCTITIKDGPVTKLTLENTTLELYKNDQAVLAIGELEAEVAQTSDVVWSSDNQAIATVDDQGKVTAISVGTAIITATIDNMKATCTVTVNPNVYVAGHEVNGQFKNVATVWINGVPQALSDGTTNASANSVYVSGDDVYVAGYVTILNKKAAVLWKNGVADIIGGENSEAKALVVKNNDVYVVGYQHNNNVNIDKDYAVLWKNGQDAIPILAESDFDSFYNAYIDINDGYWNYNNYAYAVGVDDNGSVTIACSWTDSDNFIHGFTWTDGEISDDYSMTSNVTTSIYVNGTDVYSVINNLDSNGNAYFRKNNAFKSIYFNAKLSSVFVVDEDVYTVGYTKNGNYEIATLWKSNVEDLEIDGEALSEIMQYNSRATGVYVVGDTVYVAGYQASDSTVSAVLWKNGVAQVLSNTDFAFAFSIFVK